MGNEEVSLNPFTTEYFGFTETSLDTVLAYKQRNKIGRFAEKEEESTSKPVPELNIPLGSRCEVETAEEGFHKQILKSLSDELSLSQHS